MAQRVEYDDGRVAVELHVDATGFIYYPNGRVAVCISAAGDEKRTHFFYDNDRGGSLIGSLDEHGAGFVQNHMTERRAKGKGSALSQRLGYGHRLVLTRERGMLVDGSNNVSQEWTWDRKRQNAGTPPDGPLEMVMSPHLSCRFTDRRDIVVTFQCKGVQHAVSCGQQLQREGSYLDRAGARPAGKPKGAVAVAVDAPSLQERQEQLAAAMAGKAALRKPSSRNAKVEEVAGMMRGLETHFRPLEERRRSNQYAASSIEPGWKEAALAKTLSEVPPVEPAGTEMGGVPEMVSLARTTLGLGASRPATSGLGGSRGGAGLGDTATSMGSALGRTARQSLLPPDVESLSNTFGVRSASGGKASGAARGERLARMNALQVRREVEKENPVLARTATLRQNSGRYSRDASVQSIHTPTARLPTLGAAEVEAFARAAPRGQVVVVACLRNDSRECERARQVLEQVHALRLRGALPGAAATGSTAGSRRGVSRGTAASGGGRGEGEAESSSSRRGASRAGGQAANSPFSLVAVDMAESRGMVRRYGVHTVPFFLMFVGGELVRGTTLGGRARLVASGRALPRVLLVEPSFKDQLKEEKVLRRAGYVADLAVSDKEAPQRDRVTKNDQCSLGSRGYGIVLLSGELEAAGRREAAAPFLSRAGTGSAQRASPAPLLVTLHPYGTYRAAARMCPLCEELCGRKANVEGWVSSGDTPVACPHCSIIEPSTSQVAEGGHVGCMKPLRPATMAALNAIWRRRAHQQRGGQGVGAATAAATVGKEAEPEGDVHLGLSKERFVEEVMETAKKVKAGQAFPSQGKGRFGLTLPSEETVFRGVTLRKHEGAR